MRRHIHSTSHTTAIRPMTFILFVFFVLFPLCPCANAVRFERFSGGYDRKCITGCNLPRICGYELFLRIVDTKIANLTIGRAWLSGEEHRCDVRNLSLSLIDVKKKSNLIVDDDGMM